MGNQEVPQRRLRRCAAVILGLLVLQGRPAAGGPSQWRSSGPYGGLILEIEVDPAASQRVLVLTTRGTFLSTNAGAKWTRLAPGGDSPLLVRATFAAGSIYCACGSAVYVSPDGSNWRKKAALPGRIVSLACQGGQREAVLCLFVGLSRADRPEFWIGREGPAGWEHARIGEVPVAGSCRLVVNPQDPKALRVFLLPHQPSGKSVLIGSDNGGKTWRTWSLGIRVHSPGFLRSEPKAIYAAAAKEAAPGGLLGLRKSADGGRTWKPVIDSPRLSQVRSFMFHPKSGQLLLGTSDVGLLRTADLGKTVTELNNGLQNRNVSALAADPANADVLYAGTQWGLSKTTDGGKSWHWASDGLAACQIAGVVAFAADPDRICLFEFHQGMRVSGDGGETWSPPRKLAGLPPPVMNVRSGGRGVLVTAGAGAALSRDMGRTWTAVEGLGKGDYVPAIASESEIYAVRDSVHLLRSTDGSSWRHFAGPFRGIGRTVWWAGRPPGGEYVAVGGANGVFLCRADDGRTVAFSKVPAEIGALHVGPWAFAPSRRGQLYAASVDGELARFTVRTRRWTKLKVREKAGPQSPIVGIAFDPGREQRQIVAFADGHVAVTGDSGETWKPLRPEPPLFSVSGVAVTGERRLIIAGNGTVYALDLRTLD